MDIHWLDRSAGLGRENRFAGGRALRPALGDNPRVISRYLGRWCRALVPKACPERSRTVALFWLTWAGRCLNRPTFTI